MVKEYTDIEDWINALNRKVIHMQKSDTYFRGIKVGDLINLTRHDGHYFELKLLYKKELFHVRFQIEILKAIRNNGTYIYKRKKLNKVDILDYFNPNEDVTTFFDLPLDELKQFRNQYNKFRYIIKQKRGESNSYELVLENL